MDIVGIAMAAAPSSTPMKRRAPAGAIPMIEKGGDIDAALKSPPADYSSLERLCVALRGRLGARV
jgi:hypothetical protein